MNGLTTGASSTNDVKYPPNVANGRAGRGMSCAELEVDKLYEPKQNKKIVRFITVILYMFSVSLGAILLSLYYVFLWKNPHTQAVNRMSDNTSLLIEDHSPQLTQVPQGAVSCGRRCWQDAALEIPLVNKAKTIQTVPPTAFPKSARGVPPVASRLTLQQGSEDDLNRPSKTKNTRWDTDRAESQVHLETIRKKRSLMRNGTN